VNGRWTADEAGLISEGTWQQQRRRLPHFSVDTEIKAHDGRLSRIYCPITMACFTENISSMRTEIRFEENHIQITNRKTVREEMNKYALGNIQIWPCVSCEYEWKRVSLLQNGCHLNLKTTERKVCVCVITFSANSSSLYLKARTSTAYLKNICLLCCFAIQIDLTGWKNNSELRNAKTNAPVKCYDI